MPRVGAPRPHLPLRRRPRARHVLAVARGGPAPGGARRERSHAGVRAQPGDRSLPARRAARRASAWSCSRTLNVGALRESARPRRLAHLHVREPLRAVRAQRLAHPLPLGRRRHAAAARAARAGPRSERRRSSSARRGARTAARTRAARRPRARRRRRARPRSSRREPALSAPRRRSTLPSPSVVLGARPPRGALALARCAAARALAHAQAGASAARSSAPRTSPVSGLA